MEKPIRVLQVLTIMNRGGAETMIMNYYRAIDKNKVQFDFLLHRKDKGSFDEEIKALGGNIYYMPAISPKNYFSYKKKLTLFFNNHKYNVVHSHLNALSSIILSVAKKHKIPVRIAHSHLAVEPFILKKVFKKNTDIKATIKDTVQSLIRRQVKKYATDYFACGVKAGNWLFGKENRSKVTVINNAIDAEKFSYNENFSKKIKTKLNLYDKKIIGHVGRFNEQKNHFYLIDIFHEVVKKDKNVVLVLVGDGNLKNKIEEKTRILNIEDNVFFLGIRTDIQELLQAFDLFLFPSLYEGLPVTLVEAQAAGLKIIASSTIAKEVAFTNLVTFIELGDSPKKWSETILKTIKYDRKNTFKEIVEGNYDIYENVHKLQSFYLNKHNQ